MELRKEQASTNPPIQKGRDLSSSAENPIVDFVAAGSDWEERIFDFLREHPDSTLLIIVLHLWPDFLAFPASRRAPTWFWLKDRLQRLTDKGFLRTGKGADGVPVYAIT